MTRIGAIFVPHWYPPEDLPVAARAAEAAGLGELWLWEDCFVHSAYAAASVALASTQNLRVGVGISPMPMRNVATSAMEIATVARLFPGRILPGMGHGVQSWMGQIGARVASPLTLMREYLPALRSLLAGETVSVSGRYVSLDDVTLGWPPADPPVVYAAAEGPKTLALAGELAQGVVLDSRHTPAEIATAVAAVRAGRERAHDGAIDIVARDGAIDIVAYVQTAFGADAASRARAVFGEEPAADVDQRFLAGDPEDVAHGARAFFDAGVDAVILLPTRDADLAHFYGSAGEVARLIEG
ncbi:LLM class flavin-dependent oxidoreductase [Microbacterium rhizosphaerae]|uniref:LLM class flavin-dependent oxidoreductase n=1 Tax=Microbacterium rhizosphaerae TaxID=1678237 RepID=A0ABZ0SHE0_9MICO|nr:LLM class flavin-dependent oxidoreductase [Microbacterium rhizosphaerae]WPR88634.1 LLM class flavin-dependent oxidoreductase [Microbacterium rhizosphaerae]